MELLRLFVALDFEEGEEFFRQIQDSIRQTIGEVALVSYPSSFHMTLKFLGEVDESRIGKIMRCLDKVRMQGFAVQIASLGCFPSVNAPQIIWVGAEESKALGALQQEIVYALGNEFRERKGFVPHVTIARVRKVRDPDALRESLKEVRDGCAQKMIFEVRRFSLYESDLSKGKSIYTIVRSYGLQE